MALETYQKKRDFTVTSEPKGSRRAKKTGGNSFVVQKHAARRLHYDFRLEMDGVLKSWAVTRGPSLVPGEKRLAVHVEDHPLEYGTFEGTIPRGEYGGGTVIIWDRGEWTALGDAHKGYAKGHLEFELKGEKLSGRWHLIRMAHKPREKRENWLLIKGEDEAAREEGDPDILEEQPQSVATGRDIEAVSGEEPGWSSKTGRIDKGKKRAKAKGKQPSEPAPQARAETDPASVKGARKAALPAFFEPALATLSANPPAGGKWLHEIKFDGYRIQARIEAGRVKLLTRRGLDWTRKFGKQIAAALSDLPVGSALLDGEIVVENDAGASDFSALQADLSEGRSDRFIYFCFDLLHLDGKGLTGAALAARWIKSKCSARQEFVIGGYVPSTVSRNAVGSLVLGQYEGGELRYSGRVGTGFTMKAAEDLQSRLEQMREKASPFAGKLSTAEARQVRFVRPERVAEVEFRAWTADWLLRHASFRGIREDKAAEEVVREEPVRKGGSKAAPAAQARTVNFTHPDRLYWPQDGVTKEGLADYYSEVWRHIAPFVTGRPLALLRGPNGITGELFFQKHAWKGLNKNIRLVSDPAEPDDHPLIAIDSLDGLMGLVQSGVLEIHPWGSTLADWERPDMIIMDLDPGEGIEWQAVTDAALEVKGRLEQAGLAAFVKTSGGKGLHVVAPLKPSAQWPQVKAFTKAIADSMSAESPDKYVATIAKAKRTGKILVDYLRNQRGATAVAPYSTRARPGASVSMPISWDELGPDIGPAHFTVYNAPPRLAALTADPWADFRKSAAALETKPGKRRK